MSKLSYQLFKNTDGTWRAEIPFPGRKNGISIHQTGEKDRAKADRSAKRRCHRLPIEDRAHKKHNAKRLEARGQSGPGKPGRPRKVRAPAPAPSVIDPALTAAKLKALPIDSGAGPVEPAIPAPVPTAPDPTPESPDSPPAPPAEPLPPLPDAPPAADPLKPEVGDDRDPDAEGNEFFADVIAGAIVVGTVRVTSEWAKKRKPPKKAREPSAKCLEWYTEGLQFRLRAFMGNAALTPTTKLLVGGAGVIVSMLWGAEDLDPAAPAAARREETSEPAPAPERQSSARAEPEHEQYEEPLPRQLAGTNGHDAAGGRFR